jgi:hypothetical protein
VTPIHALRRLAPAFDAAPAVLAGSVAAALQLAGQHHLAIGAALIAIVTAGLALHVDLPWGGRLTLGHAVLIALVVRVNPLDAAVIAIASVVLALPVWLHHAEEGSLFVRIGGAVSVLAAALVGIGVRVLLDSTHLGQVGQDVLTVIHTGVIGVAFLWTDHEGRSIAGRRAGESPDVRQAWPLYVTILCVAALIDVALRRSFALALVATVPLVVTRYSFQRYTVARRTYAQTTQALSLLPEVAGLTPLGHGERTAMYAASVAAEMGFDALRVRNIETAARLHHIGHISLHEPEERSAAPDPAALAAVSAEILDETGFLADMAGIVGDAQPGGPPTATLEGAVVRVCSTLDELLESRDTADPFAALVALYPAGHERSVSVSLLGLHHRRPRLVDDARGAAAALARVAEESASHGHDHAH